MEHFFLTLILHATALLAVHCQDYFSNECFDGYGYDSNSYSYSYSSGTISFSSFDWYGDEGKKFILRPYRPTQGISYKLSLKAYRISSCTSKQYRPTLKRLVIRVEQNAKAGTPTLLYTVNLLDYSIFLL